MLCQHVQNTQLIQNNILEKLSVPDETENIVYYTRESRLSFSIKLVVYLFLLGVIKKPSLLWASD